MRRWLAFAFLALLCCACSEPQCLDNEEKVGNTCQKRQIQDPKCGADARDDGLSAPCGSLDASAQQNEPEGLAADAANAKSECGNGRIEVGERCDGNCPVTCPDDDDPCTKPAVKGADCNRECGFDPVVEKARDSCCVPGERYADDTSCRCGNLRFDPPEECDDANERSGDGCTPDCKLEDLKATPGDDRRSCMSS
jgi:cysteine-rich repeat protein